MSKTKKNIYGFLRGDFLTYDESALRNWRIIIFIVFLLLIIISSVHSADKKVMKIAKLNKQKRELRAEYVDTGTILMRIKMESSIRKKVRDTGLKPAKKPPTKIKIINKDS